MIDSRHYHLPLILLAIAFTLLGATGFWLIAQGWIFIYLPLIILVWGGLAKLLIKQADRVPNQVNYFLRSLLNGDFTIHYPRTKNVELDNMYKDMNTIINLYRDSLTDIEYKQHHQERLQRTMTHELRNTIAPIINLSNDILNTPEKYTPERIHRSVEVIHKQCLSIKGFLDAFHQLTNLPAPTKTEIDIKGLFNQLQMLLEHPSLHFTWGNGTILTADKDQLTQVLINLIRNAREATEGIPDAHIEVTAFESNGEPYILVADNGPGVPEEIAEKIFLPFYSTKNGGSGIGLCLSRQIMKLHGGDLTLHSHHGTGATFMITFDKGERTTSKI